MYSSAPVEASHPGGTTNSRKSALRGSLGSRLSVVVLVVVAPVVLVFTVVIGWRQGAMRRPPHLPGDNPLNLLLPILWGMGGAAVALLTLAVVTSTLFLASTVLHRRRHVGDEDLST